MPGFGLAVFIGGHLCSELRFAGFILLRRTPLAGERGLAFQRRDPCPTDHAQCTRKKSMRI